MRNQVAVGDPQVAEFCHPGIQIQEHHKFDVNNNYKLISILSTIKDKYTGCTSSYNKLTNKMTI